NPDGTMNDVLIQRLEKTLEIAQQLPDALIIVTGGVPQNNQTEGKLMADWLIKKGIKPERIYQDNYARSTVENALYSRYALAKHRIKNAIIISSGSHVRRADALFTIASWESGP
ncbi:YdcF family protein, partial [Yersinia pestis]